MRANTRGIAVLGGLLVMAAAASGEQTAEQQKCINALNKNMAKIAATAGKNNAACVKSASKGSPSATCVPDGGSKIAAVVDKALSDESTLGCLGANAPDFGYAGVNASTSAALAAAVGLFRGTYGTTDTTGVIATDKLTAKCQATVTKGAEKLMAAKWKQYLSCKKSALKAGAASSAALSACLYEDPNSVPNDPKGKIGKAFTKLANDLQKQCAHNYLPTLFSFACSAYPQYSYSLSDCLDRKASCQLCVALNTIDGMDRNCDAYDDGSLESSCDPPVVGGATWYVGNAAFIQSCDQICASFGKIYDPATRTYAGDLGTDANCQAVLTAIGLPPGPLGHPSETNCPDGLGCSFYFPISGASYRCASPATTSTASANNWIRACACQ